MGEGREATDDAERAAAGLRLAVGRIARRLRQQHAVGDLALSEVSVLSRLSQDGPESPSVLADLERVRPQAMANTLAVLEERGLVRRRPDTADGRRVVLTATEEAERVLLDRRSESVQRLTTVLRQDFDEAELGRLLTLLPLLERLAERL